MQIHLSDVGTHYICVMSPVPRDKSALHPLMISSPHLNSMWSLRLSSGLPDPAAASESPAGAGGGCSVLRGAVARLARVLGEMEPAWKVKPGQVEVLLNIPIAQVLKALFSL